MKFLHEMIAKKRAQHDALETGGPGVENQAGEELPRHGVLHEIEAGTPARQDWSDDRDVEDEDLFDDGSYDWDLEEIADEMADDDVAEDEVAEDEIAEDEVAEDDRVEDDMPDAMPVEAARAMAAMAAADELAHEAEAEADENWDENTDDDEDDWDEAGETDEIEEDAAFDAGRIAAMAAADTAEEDAPVAEDSEPAVLRDLVVSRIARAEEAPAPEHASRSSLEESVEKLRIQRKIWDMQHDDDTEIEEPEAPAMREPDASAAPLRVERQVQPERPAPAPEAQPVRRAQPQAPIPPAASDDAPQLRRAGRVKTRILGFHKEEDAVRDPFAAAREIPEPAPQGEPQFPVGWMVVVKGPGRGASFTLISGVSRIGRGEDQTVRLDFGDTSISRDNHAAVAYDAEQRTFYIGHGGKANLVRLNDMPVLSTEPLSDGDLIRIGETSLQFVAFCGPDFSWEDGDGDSRYAAAE